MRVRSFGAVFPQIGDGFGFVAEIVERFAGEAVAPCGELRQ